MSKTPTKVRVVNYAEQDYHANKPPLHPELRGDERVLESSFAQGKAEVMMHISERNAARTRYGLYLLLPERRDCHRGVFEREVDLYLTRGELLALPGLLRATIAECEKVGMFDRGPSLWIRRELNKASGT